MSGMLAKNFIATGGNAVTMCATTMPTSFGQLLNVAREKRGLSLEDAVHETRIPAPNRACRAARK
jgi:hypothetical protein